jgi:hypothetical protein
MSKNFINKSKYGIFGYLFIEICTISVQTAEWFPLGLITLNKIILSNIVGGFVRLKTFALIPTNVDQIQIHILDHCTVMTFHV